MPLTTIPTLAEILQRIYAAIIRETRGLLDPSAPNARVVRAIAKGQAAEAHLFYQRLTRLARQMFIDTATGSYLERWANIWGISRLRANVSTGTITASGATGAVVPINSILQTSTGLQFQTTEETTFTGATASIPIESLEGGLDYNLDAGTTLTFLSPIYAPIAVDTTATVATGGTTGGTDDEEDESLRSRLLARIQLPPHGGSNADYVAWILAFDSEITNAWVFDNDPVWGVLKYCWLYGNRASPVPTDAELAAMSAYIGNYSNQTGLKPVGVNAYAVGLTEFTQNFWIELKSYTGELATVKAAIEAELEDEIYADREPGGTHLVSHFRNAIGRAAGELDYDLAVPSADVVLGFPDVMKMGVIYWI